MEPILKVAVDVPLSRLFDYLPPAGTRPVAGSRVLVPFGRRRAVGVVMSTAAKSELPGKKLRRGIALLDDEPILAEEDRRLLGFVADYYHHPIGEVVSAALPVLLRQGKPLAAPVERLAATAAGREEDLDRLARRAPRQAELLRLLTAAGGEGVAAEALTAALSTWRRIAPPLEERGLVERFETGDEPEAGAPLPSRLPAPRLNDDQAAAVAAVRGAEGFSSFVLDGVTGSGKTEVYLALIADVLSKGRQALVLVPEIGLTPQLVARLEGRLGIRPVVLHSALTDAERLSAWRQAAAGVATLVVGTRSAVFTPLPRPGLIVVDEEHDPSFKQQDGLRYSARDVAIARAKQADVPILLGSATPSLELLEHVDSGRYRQLSLPRRAGGAEPPALGLVDLSRNPAQDGLSEPLAEAVGRHTAAGGQALLFLNRRGYAPTLICADCGHVAGCRRCDARMTVHAAAGQLRCHHCGAARPLDPRCEECGRDVRPLGEGTERLEEAVARRFGGRRIARIDSDTTQRKGAIDDALARAAGGEADILVGTQMLSKGHHFPALTLVGVVNADQGLFGTDFRADERLAQTIVQVAGRAGREDRRGEVLIQTAYPKHAFWQRLMTDGYARVARDALAERRASGWPPYSRLALLRASSTRRAHALEFLAEARRLAAASRGVTLLGPVDAPMAKRAGRQHAQLLMKSTDRQALHRALSALRPALEESPAARRVRWSIDVDPIEMF